MYDKKRYEKTFADKRTAYKISSEKYLIWNLTTAIRKKY